MIQQQRNEIMMANWSRDGPRLKSENLRRGCRLQNRGTVQGRNGTRQHIIAHRRGGREARLARGGIQEHEALLGHEMRGPAGTGTGCGGVSIASGWQGQGAKKGEGVRSSRLPSPPCSFLRIYLCISAFCLDEEGC